MCCSEHELVGSGIKLNEGSSGAEEAEKRQLQAYGKGDISVNPFLVLAVNSALPRLWSQKATDLLISVPCCRKYT